VLYPHAVDRTMWNENGGDSVEAQIDRAEATVRTNMVVTVECLLLPVNLSTRRVFPVFTLANTGLFITRYRAFLFSDFLLNLFLRL
jgi:hypothetical protein